MEVAFPTELLDEDPARPFRLEGNGLFLGRGVTANRIFERLP